MGEGENRWGPTVFSNVGKLPAGGGRNAVQCKVTAGEESGWHRPLLGDKRARGLEGESSINGWENGRGFGQRRFVKRGSAGWDSREGAGLSRPLLLLFYLSLFFCKININISFVPATCRPPSQKMFSICL